ncbi:hypothetical protein GIB67_005790 [Kingdonia uniflora]|uniref:DUF8039 domain-containing protein n=1 Tax=Kingdonia uniflora TaxID=39325 RepID=A0A7J7KVP0_9MAGN|nr:hypothetical protein GIB67_005790 [Kingdonia uniflora]
MLEDKHKAAHRYVLFNFEEVQPYLEKHKSELIRQDCRLQRNDAQLSKKYSDEFNEWFKHEVKLSRGDTTDRRNLSKKMIPVQIDIARKAKRTVENLGTTNNLNPRACATIGLRRSAQPEIVPEIQKFIVPYEVKKLALMIMGKDWREHKVQKRKVIDIEDDLEQALTNFPEDVPYDQWKVFAEQYTTSEYKETRRKHIDVRKNHKLPHSSSRLGYPRLEHKMDQIGACEVDLTVLFGPERTRRVRVTGFRISPMIYSSVQHSGVLVQSLQEEVKELREEVVLVQSLKDEVSSLRVQMAKLEKFMPNQISAQDETPLPKSNRLASVSRKPHTIASCKCKLFWFTPSNVVATGHWYNEEPTCKVHNVPLGTGMSKVSIQIALKEDVPLARGNDHLKTIGDACGSFLGWPTPFIIKEQDFTGLTTSPDNYGCILADDMGFEKTLQSITLLYTLLRCTFS